MKTAPGLSPEFDLISCPESRDVGTTSSRPGARLTQWVGRASLPFYWLVTFILIQQGAALAAEKADPALVPSIFSPESAPAHAISHLAGFVLVITAAIFIVVAGLLGYAVVRFRRRANDDETEPAQVYGSGPVETAWTTVPFLIVVVLTLTTARVIQQVQDARKPAAALDGEVIRHRWEWVNRNHKL